MNSAMAIAAAKRAARHCKATFPCVFQAKRNVTRKELPLCLFGGTCNQVSFGRSDGGVKR